MVTVSFCLLNVALTFVHACQLWLKTKMWRNYIYLAVALSLIGCAQLQALPPFTDRQLALRVAYQLTDPDLAEGDRTELVTSVHTRYEQRPNNENLLAVAVTYGIPGQTFSSTDIALEFLDKIDMTKLSASSRKLADWLKLEYQYRQELEASNGALAMSLENSQRALERAREKIQILTRIENTIGSGK